MTSSTSKNTLISRDFVCPSCNFTFELNKLPQDKSIKFCVYCGASLKCLIDEKTQSGGFDISLSNATQSSPTLIPGHIPNDESIQFNLGPYQILHSIGRGGMGEVYLAYDTTCGRRIAIKRIRTDLMDHIQMHNRFLKEARITSQLTHPAIMPIYAIQSEGNLIYYTMPYIEGETLKQILRRTRTQEKKGEKLDHVGGSIPSLIRIFISICQAIAYAHSQGVLHRDLKPENIMVGRYGEVVILDWGLAKVIRGHIFSENEELAIPHFEKHPLHGLTNIGKVVGTVAYMAPERAIGQPASIQTDIYSLGVILYQLLTLRYPFKRGTLKDFRQHMHEEVLLNPAEVAPYRDVPPMLSRIAMRCLSVDPYQRYKTVNEVLRDIENYIEGRSEWFLVAELDVNQKDNWEFQENVLIAEHVAITRGTETSDWVSLMISKDSFAENTRMEAKVKLGEKGHGIGFLLSIPESAERENLNDGYCLWLGNEQNRSTKLLRSTVEVIHNHDIFLKHNEWYQVRIEKIDNNIYFYLNDMLQFSYISHMPLVGTHVGLLSRDADFSISHLQIYSGSQNISLNCLAVPDAFLAHKDYITALSEYRRIGYSFPGRAEGREALFRAGITLLEQAKDLAPSKDSNDLYEQSLLEFEKLHQTPGAPLEYLGKALVYQTMREFEEEIKCFELAYRRYSNHPLLKVLQEQIIYRMHDSSRYHRKATYNFILLVVRYISRITKTNNARKLFMNLEKHWEPLFFIEEDQACHTSDTLRNHFFGIQLAFWLARPYVLCEIIDELATLPLAPITICNALYCLIELGAYELASEKAYFLIKEFPECKELVERCQSMQIALAVHEKSVDEAIDRFIHQNKELAFTKRQERIILHILDTALQQKNSAAVRRFTEQLEDFEFTSLGGVYISCAHIWACLLEKDWKKSGELLLGYPLELLSQETTPLHFLYGCWLHVMEGKEIANIHFNGIFEVSYPRSWSLFSHWYNGKIIENQGWFEKAFLWEKRQIYKQLELYYLCIGNDEKASFYHNEEKKEYVHVA